MYGFYKIRKYFDVLQDEEIGEEIGILYEENLTTTLLQALFNIFAMIRRILMVFVLTVFKKSTYSQIVALTWLSLINGCYIASEKPYLTSS